MGLHDLGIMVIADFISLDKYQYCCVRMDYIGCCRAHSGQFAVSVCYARGSGQILSSTTTAM